MEPGNEPAAVSQDVSARVVVLERRVGQMRLAIVVVALAGLAGILLVGRAARMAGDNGVLRSGTIEATRIVLRDGKGRKRAVFEVQDSVRARLVFLRVGRDLLPFDDTPGGPNDFKGPMSYTAGLESWGERGHVFVREGEGLAILGGRELTMSPIEMGLPDLVFGHWAGHRGLAVAGETAGSWVYFPATSVGAEARSGSKRR